MSGDQFISIVHLTDLHLFADLDSCLVGIPTNRSFQAVLTAVKQTIPKIDLLLLTGDLSQDCSGASYEFLRQALDAAAIPAYCLAGNHDDLHLMAEYLPSEYVHLVRSQNIGGWRILLLSSVVVGAVHGNLAASELAWLEESLQAYPSQPTLIAFHHPAIAIGSAWMDEICLTNQEQFWQICDRYPQIQAVINGHAHQDFDQIYETVHNSVRCLVSPSTCVQFQPQTPKLIIDNQAPAWRHLRLYADGTISTEVHRLSHASFPPDLTASGY